MVLLEGARLKTLNIITREVGDPFQDVDKEYYDALDRDAFENAGMRVVYRIDRTFMTAPLAASFLLRLR